MLLNYGISSLLVDFISLTRKLLFCLYLADFVCQMQVPHTLIKDYFLLCLEFHGNNAIFFRICAFPSQ